jgi:hypothetical protein
MLEYAGIRNDPIQCHAFSPFADKSCIQYNNTTDRLSKMHNNYIISFALMLLGCSRPDSPLNFISEDDDSNLKILIAYDGTYEFSSDTQLKLSFEEYVADGPSIHLGDASIAVARLPASTKVAKSSIPNLTYAWIASALESSNVQDIKFTVIDEGPPSDRSDIRLRARESLGENYSKDTQAVYHHGTIKLYLCDPLTFQFIDTRHPFVRDATHVYMGSRLIAEADAVSFKVVDYLYQRDAKRFYYYGTAIDGSNVETFQILPDSGYARDQVSAYYNGKKIIDADPASFSAIGAFHAKDKNAVYFAEKRIPTADGATFKALNPSIYAVDAKSAFWQSIKLQEGTNAANFRVFTKDNENADTPAVYATDGNLVFFDGKSIPGVDAASFEVLPSITMGWGGWQSRARDKNRNYSGTEPSPRSD